MKIIKNFTIGTFILVMILGNVQLTRGQASLEFFETYTYADFKSNLDPDDPFFSLVDTRESHPANAILGFCGDAETQKLWKYIQSKAFLKQLPPELSFAWGPASSGEGSPLYALKKTPGAVKGPEMDEIEKVSLQKDEVNGGSNLSITFDQSGAKKWAEITRNNVGKNLAIVIDGKVYAAPKVMAEIRQGRCLISGKFEDGEIEHLKQLLE